MLGPRWRTDLRSFPSGPALAALGFCRRWSVKRLSDMVLGAGGGRGFSGAVLVGAAVFGVEALKVLRVGDDGFE